MHIAGVGTPSFQSGKPVPNFSLSVPRRTTCSSPSLSLHSHLPPPQTPQLQSFWGFLPNEPFPSTHLAVVEADFVAGRVGAQPEQSEEQLAVGRDTHGCCQLASWWNWSCWGQIHGFCLSLRSSPAS